MVMLTVYYEKHRLSTNNLPLPSFMTNLERYWGFIYWILWKLCLMLCNLSFTGKLPKSVDERKKTMLNV